MPTDTWLTCRANGCTRPATEVIVTIREGFCFERCTHHARAACDPLAPT